MNCCLICKSIVNKTKHHIIPQCFLTVIGNQYSSTVTLCKTCHDKYETRANKLRVKLTKTSIIVQDIEAKNKVKHKVRAAGRALTKNNALIPSEKIEFLKSIIIDYFGELNIDAALSLRTDNTDSSLTIESNEIKDIIELWFTDFIMFNVKER